MYISLTNPVGPTEQNNMLVVKVNNNFQTNSSGELDSINNGHK